MNLALVLISLAAAILIYFEFRKIRRRRAQRARQVAWPEFEDAYISALQSGVSIADAFSFANDFELPQLGAFLKEMVRAIDRGASLVKALEQFRVSVALSQCDLFVEIVALAHKTGGHNLIQSLTEHSRAVRQELAARGDVEARQSAILGVAKLGLLAPWILVAVLSVNEQTRLAFNSTSGNLLLVAGFAVSFLSYRMIVAAGRDHSFTRFLGALDG